MINNAKYGGKSILPELRVIESGILKLSLIHIYVHRTVLYRGAMHETPQGCPHRYPAIYRPGRLRGAHTAL